MSIMRNLFDIPNQLALFTTIRINDYIDILIIAFLTYKITAFFKNTRSVQVLKGIVVLVVAEAGGVAVGQLGILGELFFEFAGFLVKPQNGDGGQVEISGVGQVGRQVVTRLISLRKDIRILLKEFEIVCDDEGDQLAVSQSP